MKWSWAPPSLRLHQQLVLVVSTLVVVAIALLGGYTALAQGQAAEHALRQQASMLARFMALSSSNLILTNSLDQVETLALHTLELPDVVEVQVSDPLGQPLAHVERTPQGQARVVFDPPGQAMPLPPRDVRLQALPHIHEARELGVVRAWYPIQAGQLVGWVRVDYLSTSLAQVKRQIWQSTLVVGVLAVALCGGLLVLFMRPPMKALARATRFAIRLPQADGRQLKLHSGPTEVMQLVEGLNEASLRLHHQLQDIQQGVEVLQAHEAQLALQNEQLNALFALSPDGLMTFNADHQVQFVNQAFLTLTGLSDVEVIGMTQPELDAALRQRSLAPQAFAGLDACFAPADAQGAKGQMLSFASPHTRVVRMLGLRTQGQAVSQVLYAVDVTQQHQLDTIKSEFLSMAAHELRTPMASIYGFTELMMKRAMKPEQQQDLLGRIYRQSQLMISILNELLDLARIESRRGQDFTLETLPLVLCVQSALTDFKVPEGRDPPLTSLPSDLALKVRVDRQKFQQALLNILSNAYKYSPGGGAVEVSLVQGGAIPGAELGIVIADHGMGLRPDELARWGERFFRADKSGNIPGTGLGVSIVKELLELMGGHLAVSSQHGQGTQVTLWLPRIEVSSPTVA